MGDPRIPYDQTDPMQQVAAPQGAAPAMPGGQPPDMAGLPLGGGAPSAGGGASLLAGLGGQSGGDLLGGGLPGVPQEPAQGGSTDQLTGDDLAALSGEQDVGNPEDVAVAQMEAALDDPNTPPDVKAQIQQQLDLAARRRLAGLGGASQGGGF